MRTLNKYIARKYPAVDVEQKSQKYETAAV